MLMFVDLKIESIFNQACTVLQLVHLEIGFVWVGTVWFMRVCVCVHVCVRCMYHACMHACLCKTWSQESKVQVLWNFVKYKYVL